MTVICLRQSLTDWLRLRSVFGSPATGVAGDVLRSASDGILAADAGLTTSFSGTCELASFLRNLFDSLVPKLRLCGFVSLTVDAAEVVV